MAPAVKKGSNYLYLLLPILLLAIGVGVWDFATAEDESTPLRADAILLEHAAEKVSPAKTLEGAESPNATLQREVSSEESVSQVAARDNWVELFVFVKRGEQSEPAAFAKGFLLHLHAREYRAQEASRANGLDPWNTAKQSGIAFTADAEGKATVLVPPGPILAVAKDGNAYAERWLNTTQKNVTLDLEEDLGFQVLVINEGGEKLVGFPLGIHRFEEGYVSQLGLYLSDSDGMVSLRHIQSFLPHGKIRPRVVLTASAPFRDAPEIELSLDNSSKGTIEYLVPHHGSVLIHLLDADGIAEKEDCKVVLQRESAGRDMWADFLGFQKRFDLGGTEATSKEGEVFFPYVGIGFDLRVAAWFPESKEPTEEVFAGPSQLGTTISVTINPGEATPGIRFRAMDTTGAILGNRNITVQSYHEQGSFGSTDEAVVHTNEFGIGLYPVTSTLEKSTSQSLEMEFVVMGTLPELKSRVVFQEKLHSGPNDAGDVVFYVGPLACSGTIVNEFGSPVVGASLQLKYEDGQTRWRRMDQQSAKTNEQGGFIIRGKAFLPRATLVAKHRDYPQAEFLVEHGSEGLSLVMKSGFEVRGKVLLDDGIDTTHIRLVVAPFPLPLDPGGAVWQWPRQLLQGSGYFHIRIPTNEERTLVLVDTQSGVLLGKLEQVTPSVADAEENPRLAQWDMRGQLSMFSLRFLNSESLPVSQVTLDLEGQMGFSSQEEVQADFWRGSGALILPSTQLRFTANAPDMRVLHGQVDGPGEKTFVMEKGWPVEVQLYPLGLPEKSWRIYLGMEPVAEGGHYPDIWNVDIDDTGILRFAVPQPGEYRASLNVQLRNRNGSTVVRSFPEDELRPLWLVMDSQEVQKFELTVDLSEIEAFIQEH